ncbi:jg8081, partial [Pararge aegeria aegeria]
MVCNAVLYGWAHRMLPDLSPYYIANGIAKNSAYS